VLQTNKTNTIKHSKNLPWLIFISFVFVVTIGGYFLLYPQKLFKPGERLFDLGYDLGLAGGSMMLILLLYPLRKRLKILNSLGTLSTWFKWHMVLGIVGPLTIIFHSTYHVYIPYIHPTGSPNAAVAMLCMLLVSGSGTFGRFFYTKIHHGLYGRQATVKELYAVLESSGDVESVFGFAPSVKKALEDFHAGTVGQARHSGIGFVNFISVGFQAMVLSRRLSREVRQILHAQAAHNNSGRGEIANVGELVADYQKKISAYLKAVRDASQFQTYEKLFSWWHIFHIPLVYMMVFSAIYHVYAVHAY
jgi:hypothetical protein